MERDPIVSEVRALREAYARTFNYDLRAIFRDLKEQENKSGRKIVLLAPRQLDAIELSSRSMKQDRPEK